MARVILPVFSVVFLLAGVLPAFAAEPTVKPQDLPRVKPTEPADAIKTFQVRKGFHVEVAAAEPLVIDPIAMCFDENGRLFVVEMRDYSERRAEKLGRIRMLEDTDGDGKFDKSTIFLDHLPWPTAVLCVNGGVLVGACPDIIFAKDTNGDGVADETKVLFSGFGSTQEKLNVQGLFNNFIWGLDNRIHGCSGHDGGMVSSALHPTTQPLDVRTRGFVIDPRDWSMTPENGGGQYGLSFDHLGRLFTCTNSSHCETFMNEARYAARNPFYTMPDARVSIAADGPAAEVYRISPEEPWRVIRTRWRIAGLVGGPVEGGGRSAGYFTGATGITIYRGDAFGPDYTGDAFVGDAGGNLVHHKRIRIGPDGLTPVAQRPDDEKKLEFCASSDNWFRPVDFANAPDGCLYIADMYREVIEHPWSLPPAIKQYLDLNSGNDRGRIFRLAPDGFHPGLPPRLASQSTAELVKLLEHPNGWHRDTAARLLFERQDKSAIPLLRELLQHCPTPLGRLHALHALDGVGAVEEDDSAVLAGMDDADATVRAHAIALSEKRLTHGVPSAMIWGRYQPLADDQSTQVRYQLAFTLGQVQHPQRNALLARLARRDLDNRWMIAAVLSSLADGAGDVFAALSEAPPADAAARDCLAQLARIIGAQNRPDQTGRVLAFLKKPNDALTTFIIARGLVDGADAAGSLAELRPNRINLFQRAADTVRDDKSSPESRMAAASLLGFEDYSHAALALFDALSGPSESVQLAALGALGRMHDSAVAGDILRRFHKLAPRARVEAIAILLKRPERASALIEAIRSGQLHQADLDASQVNQLLNSKIDSVRILARQTLAAPSTQRTAVVESFRPALTLAGDPSRGHIVYAQRCISCHRSGGEGFALGPDFVTLRNSGREKLLTNILDPSREVAPNYIAYLIETKDGQSILGVIASDTPTSITIRQAYGRETVIPRANIKHMSSQGKSMMPDGLEAGLTPQDAADLLQFVETAK